MAKPILSKCFKPKHTHQKKKKRKKEKQQQQQQQQQQQHLPVELTRQAA